MLNEKIIQNNLGVNLERIRKETKTDMCVAEMLQKSTMSIYYDPDSYKYPTITGLIYLPKEIKDEFGKCYEIEFNLENDGIIDIHHVDEDRENKNNVINIIDLPVIETDPLPGNPQQPRFDNQQ